MALDTNTRLILYKLVNGGVIDEVNGCLSTGKESVVFHGRYREDPANPESPSLECAIKVFKTTLTEFKNRQQFLHGDRRFEDRVGKQGARKLVKLWAEKEMSNLERMRQAGMPCPRVVHQRKHVLVMRFLGEKGEAAPKLKVLILL
jgi:RIO kinase 3